MNNTKDNSAIYEYVTTHIDDAIKNEWIKVYYQPVVRSLTGQLCGAESLARWIDPEVGFLSPDKFIGALEDCKKIHILDSFIIEKVCSDIHYRLDNGLPAFPVSVNFSRLDFLMCDMPAIVEATLEKYDVPRDFIHIEITESMIAQDEEMMASIISRFQTKGYEIWMDDFGSGYSSLNLLKDYQFDLLKMDMRFLSNMTEKSKMILLSTIGMAKSIGIRTLSEGVETKEQVDFLTSIGCGKLQGYYFGKPMPIDEMLENLENKGITIEERQWRDYYEAASIIIRETDVPLQILEYDGTTFKTLFANQAFKQQINIMTTDYSFFDRVLYNPTSPVISRYRKFAEKAIKSKSQESFYYTDKGNYYQIKALYLSENKGHYLFKLSVANITLDQNTEERDKLDLRLRELNHLYEVVLLINYRENIVFPLLGGYVYTEDSSSKAMTMTEASSNFAQNFLHPSDRDDFIKFMNLNNLLVDQRENELDYSKHTFRLRQRDGSYEWRVISMLSIHGTSENEFLLTISEVPEEISDLLNNTKYTDTVAASSNIDEKVREYANIWENVIQSSSQKFFWKDKDRRFKGVSQSFLDFYEIKSYDDILGKNDEEMHWHVDEGPYQGDELDVLGKGKVVYNAQGQCIVNGVVHNIICNKMPIYDKGKIVGLVGSFADIDQEIFRVQKIMNPSKMDNITRLTNSKFFLNSMIDYSIQYNETGKNYGFIVLHNASHRRIEETYGSKFASKVLKEIGEKIIDIIGQRAVASRTKEAYFGILIYIDSLSKLKEFATILKDHIEEIHHVDEKSVTIHMTTVYHLRTEEGITDETIYQQTLEEIEKLENKHNK